MIKAGTGFRPSPLFCLCIRLGLYRTENGVCGCTCGMRAFGKRGMEALHADGGQNRGAVFRPAWFVRAGIRCNVTGRRNHRLLRGQEVHHHMHEGVSLPGMTLKISYDAAD